ncbi:hypothetical protein [Streptomyces sp. NPDC048196]|uniref:hypothetical protein n=1 Tax=Streptomyces sp. NPDC048196 TaxID=3154712 RepID=UPI0033C0ED36
MAKRPGKLSRTPTSPLLVPRVVAWGVSAVLITLGVLPLGWWAGASNWHWTAVSTFPRIFSGLAAFISGQGISPGVRLGGLLLVLLALYAWWRFSRSLLGYRPGPVQVEQLVDATADKKPPRVDDLTSRLRMKLSESSLYPPTTVPAEAPPTGFLDLLGDVDLHKPGTTIPRLLSRLRPKLAYRVGGALQHREHGTEPYGITVTLTAYVFSGARATTVWGRDWEQAVCRAAYWVEASLLPVTRAGKQPPWRSWWARELPPELLRAYQEAKSLSARQRYDQALKRYGDALKFDPQNPYIRAEFAGAQEKLALPVDALETCQSGLTLDGQTADEYNKRLWIRWRLFASRFRYFFRPRAYWETLGLRYRNAIILGTSEEIVDSEEGPPPDGERMQMSDCLRHVLAERYWPVAVDFALAQEGSCKTAEYSEHGVEVTSRKWLEEHLQDNVSAVEKGQVRVVLQRAAVQELYRLTKDHLHARCSPLAWPSGLLRVLRRVWPPAYVQRNRCQPSLTRVGLMINRDVWGPLRLAWQANELAGPLPAPEDHRARTGHWRAYERRRYVMEWEGLTPETLRARVRPFSPALREWQDYYNFACVYAVAMKRYEAKKPSKAEKCNRNQLADMAVKKLEKAVLRAESGFTTLGRSWLLFEDPDLSLLRRHSSFSDFVRRTFPSAAPLDRPFPCTSIRCLTDGYARRLLNETALVMEQIWRQRGKNGTVSVGVLRAWLSAEEKVWENLFEVAKKHPGNWEDRATLIGAVQESDPATAARSDFPPGMLHESDSDAEKRHKCLSELLHSLTDDLRENLSETALRRSHAWCAILDDAIAAGVTKMPASDARTLCAQYAAAWQRLGARLRAAQDWDTRKKFQAAVHDIARPARQRTSTHPVIRI